MTKNFDIDDLKELLSDDDELKTFKETDDGNVTNWIPTLIPNFDRNLIGGVPISGQISEIMGAKSSGKSTFAASIIRNGLKMNIFPVYFDIEKTEGWVRLEQLGVDPDKVLTLRNKINADKTVKPVSIEDVGQKIIDIGAKIHKAQPDAFVLYIWDSIAYSQSEADAEADTHVKSVASAPKALNIVARKISANLVENNGGLLAFNQARVDMNAPMPKFAVAKTTGGEGWSHALSLRILLKTGSKIKRVESDKEAIGHLTWVKVPKSKIGDNSDYSIQVALIGKWGFDVEYNILLEGQELGLISKTRPKYVDPETGEELVSGKNKLEFVMNLKKPENADAKRDLWQEITKQVFPNIYPALFNTKAIMYEDKFPLIKGLRKYYINIQQNLPYAEQGDNYKLFVEYYRKHPLPDKLKQEFEEQGVDLFGETESN